MRQWSGTVSPAELARERNVPWDDARAERVGRRVVQQLSVSGRGERAKLVWVSLASVAVMSLFLHAARQTSRPASDAAPMASDYALDEPNEFEPSPLRLGDGGFEASPD